MKGMRSILIYLTLAVLVAAGAVLAITEFNLLGAKIVSVSGTVTRDTKPLVWNTEENRELTVIFIPEAKRDNSTPLYPAVTDAKTGRFNIPELPTGTYSVAVQQLNPGYHDLLGMVYDPGSTTIKVEVKEDGQEIPIDLPKVLPPRKSANPPNVGGGGAPRPAPPQPAAGAPSKDEKKPDDKIPSEKKPDDKNPSEKR